MDKNALTSALDDLISTKQGSEKIVAQLTKQVWQIDWTVAPFDVVGHYLEFDIPYFYRFMQMDAGDEEEEMQIIRDWVDSRGALDKETKAGLVSLVEELNQLRVSVRQG
ncbi:MAG: hypothetical protein AAF298_25600 [Cyanobacteria bacterium P01_A01_bin.40]